MTGIGGPIALVLGAIVNSGDLDADSAGYLYLGAQQIVFTCEPAAAEPGLRCEFVIGPKGFDCEDDDNSDDAICTVLVRP